MVTLSIGQAKNVAKLPKTDNPFTQEWQTRLVKQKAHRLKWGFEIDYDRSAVVKVVPSNEPSHLVLLKKRLKSCSCSCDEYLDNRLGTCVHVEAVRRAYSEISRSTDLGLFWHTFLRDLPEDPQNVVYYDGKEDCLKCHPRFKSVALAQANGVEFLSGDRIRVIDEQRLLLHGHFRVFDSALRFLQREKRRSTWCRDSRIPAIVGRNTLDFDMFKSKGIDLFDYQRDAIIHLLTRKRAILALPMGYGKTLCTIMAKRFVEGLNGRPQSVFVICPASLKYQWANEIERLLGEQTFVIKDGTDIDRWCAAHPKPCPWLIGNYEIVQRHWKKLQQHFDILVLDEVQKIRNKETKTWGAIAQLESEYMWTLSGTVIENHVPDILSIIEILNEEELIPRWEFNERHFVMQGDRIEKVRDWAKLRQVLDPYVFREVGSGIAIKAKVVPTTVRVDMDPQQRNQHAKPYKRAKRLLAISAKRSLSFKEKVQLNAFLLQARQAADSAKLQNPQAGEGAKVKEITQLMESIISRGEKVVVFSEWIGMLKLLEPALAAQNIEWVRFTGKLSLKQREKKRAQFVKDPKVKVFLSTDAGGLGVDGLQLASHHVIHCELPWNPARVDQRNGRLHRLLQKSDEVHVYYVVTNDSVESDLVEPANYRKREIRRNALD